MNDTRLNEKFKRFTTLNNKKKITKQVLVRRRQLRQQAGGRWMVKEGGAAFQGGRAEKGISKRKYEGLGDHGNVCGAVKGKMRRRRR